jgi:aryl-alcohol dehydrogenase-like predicted oxidoreductase
MGILVRGPLHKGILSGRYDRETVFTDTVRSGWNSGGDKRDFYEERLRRLAELQSVVKERDLVETSLRFLMGHPANLVAIPGATRPSQVLANAAAGAEDPDPELYRTLRNLPIE